ncbi:cytochrome p450 [Moniliophthora roreri]|nr:cytochrome p450 [Moniliophthora roreri]
MFPRNTRRNKHLWFPPRTSYLMGQKGDTGPSDLTLEFFSGRTQKPPSHISNSFDNFPACSPSLRALTEVPLPSQLSIPRTVFINSRLLTSNHHHLASASPEHHSLSGFIAKTSSVVFCLPFSRISICHRDSISMTLDQTGCLRKRNHSERNDCTIIEEKRFIFTPTLVSRTITHCHNKDFKTCQSTGNPDPGFVDQYSLSPKRPRGARNDTFRSTDLDAST